MTRTALITALTLAGVAQAAPRPLDALLEAIRHVESGGDDRAVGDNGKALGPYQIWKPYFQDACEYGKVDWKYNRTNAFDRKKSRQVVIWYWMRYAPKRPTAEILSRIHNGGPKGHLKKATKKYWKKVKKQLSKGKK